MKAAVATLCPGVPLFVESISNSPRPNPLLTADFWKGYPNLHVADIVEFIKLCRRGRPIQVVKPPLGTDAKTFEKQYQQSEFQQSIAYLGHHCGAGINHRGSEPGMALARGVSMSVASARTH